MRLSATLFLFAAATAALHAQTQLGYTNGTIGKNNVARCGTGQHQGMSIRLSKEKLQMLRGKQVTGVNVVYGSRNTTDNSARVFLTKSLTATALREATLKISRATTAWTEVAFAEPYTITGDEDELFIGTDMDITASYQPLSVDFSADNVATGYVINNDTWVDAYGTGFGSPNIRVVIGGEPIAFTDAVLKSFTSDAYYKTSTPYTFSTEVFNFGTTPIESFDVEISIDGEQPQSKHYEGLSIQPSGSHLITLPPYAAAAEGNRKLSISLSNVNAKTDNDMSDNKRENDIFFYPASMQRGILVEEFTSQYCVNCPEGQNTLNNILHGHSDTFVKLFHHSGYQPDAFTMSLDNACVMFYGGASTFAPAVMLNRTTCHEVASAPVMNIGSALVNPTISYINSLQPYASLQLQSAYDATTRQLNVDFNLYCHNDMPEGPNVINVILVQDGFVANQKGADASFVHNNVCRGSLLGNAFGGVLPTGTKAGESYSWHTSLTLPETIYSDYWEGKTQPSYNVNLPAEASNMRIVAYVAHYNGDDVSDNRVYNVIETKLGSSSAHNSFTDGISLPTASAPDGTAIYDMTGRRIDANAGSLPSGMYIIRTTEGGVTTTRKVKVIN